MKFEFRVHLSVENCRNHITKPHQVSCMESNVENQKQIKNLNFSFTRVSKIVDLILISTSRIQFSFINVQTELKIESRIQLSVENGSN